MLDIINNDFRIYDEKPGEGYITGYVIQVNVEYNATTLAMLSEIIHNERLNVYAYIPTNYFIGIDAPIITVWVILATKFERSLTICKLENRTKYTKKLKYNIPTKKLVWFHENWVLKSYDPTKYDTDAKKYELFKKNVNLHHTFSEKEVLKWRKAYYKEKPCYEPKAPDTETCKNSKTDYNVKCLRCPLSHVADRYDRNGRCIIKKNDML